MLLLNEDRGFMMEVLALLVKIRGKKVVVLLVGALIKLIYHHSFIPIETMVMVRGIIHDHDSLEETGLILAIITEEVAMVILVGVFRIREV